MTRFAFAFAIASLSLGCRPDPPPPAAPADVSAPSLVRLFRDTPGIASDAYTGQRVRVYLPAGGYRLVPEGVGHPPAGVGWFGGFGDAPPAVLFRCEPPPDTARPLVIVGTCRGAVHDGIRRAPGVTFCVYVDDCSVSVGAAPKSP